MGTSSIAHTVTAVAKIGDNNRDEQVTNSTVSAHVM